MEITREQGYDSLRRIFGVFSYNRFPLLRFTIPVYDMEPIEHTDLSSAYAIIPVQYPNEIDLIEITEAYRQFKDKKDVYEVLKRVAKPLIDLLNKKGGVGLVAHILAANELELRRLTDKKEEWEAFMSFIKNRANGKPVPLTPHPGYVEPNPKRSEINKQEYEQAVKEWERYWINRYQRLQKEVENQSDGDDCEAEPSSTLPACYLDKYQERSKELEGYVTSGQAMRAVSEISNIVYAQLRCWNKIDVYIIEQGRKVAGNLDFNSIGWKEVKDSQHKELIQKLDGRTFSYNSIKGIDQYWKVEKRGDSDVLLLNEGVHKETAIKFIKNSNEAKMAHWRLPVYSESVNLFKDHRGKQLYPAKNAQSYRNLKSKLEKNS